MSLTCLPRRVLQYLRILGPCFRHLHQLVFSWLLVLHILPGRFMAQGGMQVALVVRGDPRPQNIE
jgi:hypothetical protein